MSLCQIGEGIRKQKGKPEQHKEQEHVEQEAELEREAANLLNEWGAWDDVSGVSLDSEKVKAARDEEVTWLNKKNVYQKITRQEALQRGLRIIRVRWIDVNKRDQEKPKYRSRLVAMEFKSEDKELEDLLAGTPPLEALKMLVSEAATVKEGSMGDRCMLLLTSAARTLKPMRAGKCVLRYHMRTEPKAMATWWGTLLRIYMEPETQRRTGKMRLPGP